MSLFKIPFIVAQLATFHVAMTAPHSTMQKERVKDQHWLETYVTISLSCRAIDAVRVSLTIFDIARTS
jgi:hypothetical protein